MRLLKIASSVQGLDLPHCPRHLRKPLIRQGRLSQGPDPSFTPDETSVLLAIAEETESAGLRLQSFGEHLASEIEQNAQRMIGLSTKLKELAVVRDLGHDIFNNGGSSSS